MWRTTLATVPEALEVELTRRAAGTLIGRRIDSVERTDPLVVGDGVDELVPGRTVAGIDRRGKLLLVATDGPTLGLHFGMTGRLLPDGSVPPIEQLAYGAGSDHDAWDRWVLRLDDGTRVRFHDPRLLGRVSLDPRTDQLGPDVLTLTRAELSPALAGRRAPLKAVLLDQRAVAGLGNMLVDEVLWWSDLDPRRPADELSPDEIVALAQAVRRRLPIMLRRGGSHTGTLSPEVRRAGGRCPRCGGDLVRSRVGGRTTIRCSVHQR